MGAVLGFALILGSAFGGVFGGPSGGAADTGDATREVVTAGVR